MKDDGAAVSFIPHPSLIPHPSFIPHPSSLIRHPQTSRPGYYIMILDRLGNAAFYRPLGPRIAAALDWLRATDIAALADGRYELEGDRLAAIVQRYRTRPLPKAR